MTYVGLSIMEMYVQRNLFDEQIKNENSLPEDDSTMATPTVTSPFSRSTISAFWTEKTHMAMADTAVAGLALEGIENPGDLYKYYNGELESIFETPRAGPRSMATSSPSSATSSQGTHNLPVVRRQSMDRPRG